MTPKQIFDLRQRREIERRERDQRALESLMGPKPRIRLRFGVWCCVLLMSVPPYRITTGFGRTPAEAYADWRRRIIATDYTR